MSTEELQKRTTVNIQEKANLIWAIADNLVGTYKPHEYGNVILPMCVIKRFSDTLAPTKQAVLDANALCEQRGLAVRKGFLTTPLAMTSIMCRHLHSRVYSPMQITLPITSAAI